MALREMLCTRCVIDEQKFTEAARLICGYFGVPKLHEDQQKALRAFLEGRDIYFSAHMGYGKSLVFQAQPILSDLMNEQAMGISTVLVLSPLVALMQDQVKIMNEKVGISAAVICEGQSEKILNNIEEGTVYSLVYASPECVLSSGRWRNLLTSEQFRKTCIAVVVDEGHCIVNWGTASQAAKPFRKWYGNLKELRSLLCDTTRYLVFTATATTVTKHKIFELLHLDHFRTFIVEKDPCRDNLRFCLKYVDKETPLETVFGELLQELITRKADTERTIIYCQTRKQCSLVYKVFNVMLRKQIFWKQIQKPSHRLVKMYHAGTPDSVKNHVIEQMGENGSHLRVVICTVAFGMGINCKEVTRIINFETRNMESFVQMCGRAGRSGQPSTCFLLYNGLLRIHCEESIKRFIESTSCRLAEIRNFFSKSKDSTPLYGCNCCDFCARDCNCGLDCRKSSLEYQFFNMCNENEAEAESQRQSRNISLPQRKLLEDKLKSYSFSLLPGKKDQLKSVFYPNTIYEFGRFQIKQIVDSSYKLFTLSDILKHVEIWRHTHAVSVLNTLNDVFEDIDTVAKLNDLSMRSSNKNLIEEDWEEMKDDSELYNTLGSTVLGEISQMMERLDESGEHQKNLSAIIEPLGQSVQLSNSFTHAD